ncbi:unnamed protein product [Enterobius vermicularis]|uniref:Aa_trans domain-containing protein n=1 Tax=Enterobius vermicularis TaxID=51028 RepID=A0A0N4VLQ3_ENTVE|nr:unnamed protein product [Enterobius vermicularis]
MIISQQGFDVVDAGSKSDNIDGGQVSFFGIHLCFKFLLVVAGILDEEMRIAGASKRCPTQTVNVYLAVSSLVAYISIQILPYIMVNFKVGLVLVAIQSS